MLGSKALLSVLLTTLPASAGTWIVDDDGGPGVDFTQIQPAVDAAAAGDSIQVLPGTYAGFTLNKPLVLFGGGSGLRTVVDQVVVRDIPLGTIAALADLDLSTTWGQTGWTNKPLLHVDDCAGTVVLDALQIGLHFVRVESSKDVRLSNTQVDALAPHFYGLPALALNESRVEVVGCSLRGGPGGDCNQCEVGGDGGDAIYLSTLAATSEVHAYRSILRGGDGGDAIVPFLGGSGYGGDGGHGIDGGGGPVLVAGQIEHSATGGLGGSVFGGSGFGSAGSKGCGVASSSVHGSRVSGATVVQAGAWCSDAMQFPVPEDPTLHTLGVPTPGSVIAYRVTVAPGTLVDLNLGRLPALVLVSGLSEDILIQSLRTFALGAVDGSGSIGMNFTVPSVLKPGSIFFAQARVTLPGGETRYSNSVPLVVR